MAPRSAELLKKKKEAKQKKLLFLLIPALVILVVMQGPRLIKHFNTAKEKTQSVQGQVVQGFEEVSPNGVPTTQAQAGAPATSDPAAAILATQGLPNTDTPPEADEGELVSFTRFSARDPFVQLVDEATSEATGSTTSDTGTTSDTSSTTTSTPGTSTSTGTTTGTGSTGDTSASTATTQVSISVNGTVAVVAVGDTFPTNDPAFKLVAIDGNIVKIGLAAGSFSNNVETLDLEVGDSVTLISQPDGARFTIEIVSLG